MTKELLPRLGSGALREALQKWQRKYFSAGISHEMWPNAVEHAFEAGWKAALSLSSPIEPPPDIDAEAESIRGYFTLSAESMPILKRCLGRVFEAGMRTRPTPQASSEIRELIKEWRAKADYESARWDNQGSSTAQERIDAVGDYYANALEKASRQGAGGSEHICVSCNERMYMACNGLFGCRNLACPGRAKS